MSQPLPAPQDASTPSSNIPHKLAPNGEPTSPLLPPLKKASSSSFDKPSAVPSSSGSRLTFQPGGPPPATTSTPFMSDTSRRNGDPPLDIKHEPFPPAGPSRPAGSELVQPSSMEVDGGWNSEMLRRKRKWRTMGYEDDVIASKERTLTKFQLALLQDQQATLFPPPPKKFESYEDAIDQLVAYHIWQVPEQDLFGQDLDPKREAIRDARETQLAEGLMKRVSSIQERFFKLRRREGTHPSDVTSVISLLNSSTSALRDELATVQGQLRSTRSEFEGLEIMRRSKERAAALSAAANSSTSSLLNRSLPVTPLPIPPASRPPSVPNTTIAQPPTTGPATPSPLPPVPTPGSKPRGRPRKDRAGLRETVLSRPDTPGVEGSKAAASMSRQSSTSGTESAAKDTKADQPSLAQKGTTVNAPVPFTRIPPLVKAGVVPSLAKKKLDNLPGFWYNVDEEKQIGYMRVELKKCSETQMQEIAKALNVDLAAARRAKAQQESVTPAAVESKPTSTPGRQTRTASAAAAGSTRK